MWIGEHQGSKVAVKVLKVFEPSDPDKVSNVGHCPEDK